MATPPLIAACPRCNAQIYVQLPPPPPMQPVQHAIVEWSDKVMVDERPLVAGIVEGTLILGLTNQDEKKMFLNVPLGEVVPQLHGEPAAFALAQIHPGVLKLNMSIFSPMIHAYLVIVGAPENWEDYGNEEE